MVHEWRTRHLRHPYKNTPIIHIFPYVCIKVCVKHEEYSDADGADGADGAWTHFDYVDIQQNTFVSSQVEYKSRSRGLWRQCSYI